MLPRSPSRKPPLGWCIDPSHPQALGLQLALCCNEGAGATLADATGLGGNVSLTAGCSWAANASGYPSLATSASTAYGTIARSTWLDSAAAATILCRIKQKTLGLGAYIFVKSLGGTHWFVLLLDVGGYLYGSVSNGSSNYGRVSYSGLITAETWVDIAMVFDGSGADNAERLKLYVNGVAKGLTFTGTVPSATSDLGSTSARIGWSSDALVGGYDYLFGYNRALSASEVANFRLQPYAMFSPLSGRRQLMPAT